MAVADVPHPPFRNLMKSKMSSSKKDMPKMKMMTGKGGMSMAKKTVTMMGITKYHDATASVRMKTKMRMRKRPRSSAPSPTTLSPTLSPTTLHREAITLAPTVAKIPTTPPLKTDPTVTAPSPSSSCNSWRPLGEPFTNCDWFDSFELSGSGLSIAVKVADMIDDELAFSTVYDYVAGQGWIEALGLPRFEKGGIALSTNGNFVAGEIASQGVVAVYQRLDDDKTWVPLTAEGIQVGITATHKILAISDDGRIVAVSSDADGGSGTTEVYELETIDTPSTFIWMARDLQAEIDFPTTSLSMSADGNRIAVIESLRTDTSARRARVFEWTGAAWTDLDFPSPTTIGVRASLDASGNLLAVGVVRSEGGWFYLVWDLDAGALVGGRFPNFGDGASALLCMSGDGSTIVGTPVREQVQAFRLGPSGDWEPFGSPYEAITFDSYNYCSINQDGTVMVVADDFCQIQVLQCVE
eukprot:scaffold19102_cov172-Amphora_coffeaeformis.AAC.1